MSQVISMLVHDASSSQYARSMLGPRRRSGSSLENSVAMAPDGHVRRRLLGSYRTIPAWRNRENARRPLNARIPHVGSRRSHNGDIPGVAALDLASYPFGSRARLAEAAAGEQEPHVPIAWRRKLIGPRSLQPSVAFLNFVADGRFAPLAIRN
jgi:hypothetical protein